jgi:hypothetical protein
MKCMLAAQPGSHFCTSLTLTPEQIVVWATAGPVAGPVRTNVATSTAAREDPNLRITGRA